MVVRVDPPPVFSGGGTENESMMTVLQHPVVTGALAGFPGSHRRRRPVRSGRSASDGVQAYRRGRSAFGPVGGPHLRAVVAVGVGAPATRGS